MRKGRRPGGGRFCPNRYTPTGRVGQEKGKAAESLFWELFFSNSQLPVNPRTILVLLRLFPLPLRSPRLSLALAPGKLKEFLHGQFHHDLPGDAMLRGEGTDIFDLLIGRGWKGIERVGYPQAPGNL